MLPFEEAKRVIQPVKIAEQKQFHELSKQKKLPKGIPIISVLFLNECTSYLYVT